jgi:branched-chain amino acid transport system ATP-binding protein
MTAAVQVHDAPVAKAAETILSVNNIEVIYDHVILVLKGVSLTVPKGGIVAILGANGAGKTTTLKAISNLLRAERGEVTKGSIEFQGERVDKLSPNELVRRGCIQVLEGRHCFGHLTIEENLLTGAFTRATATPPSRRIWSASTSTSRGSGSGRAPWRATRRAASSRCAPSAGP